MLRILKFLVQNKKKSVYLFVIFFTGIVTFLDIKIEIIKETIIAIITAIPVPLKLFISCALISDLLSVTYNMYFSALEDLNE